MTKNILNSHIHRFQSATAEDRPPLLLLHGTGGDENDLWDLGHQLSPGSALLSPRGNVDENGHPRFFRRLREGVFDLADVARRTHDLADFVTAAAGQHGFPLDKVAAVGFSNGANIAAALLLLRPETLGRALLLRPMVVLDPHSVPDLHGKQIAILSGRRDPIVPADHPDRLAEILRRGGATVEVHWTEAGHHLTREDFSFSQRFLGEVEKPAARNAT